MLEALPNFMEDDLHCCVCGNTNSKQFNLKYKKENFAVVVCQICDFHFIPAYYRKTIQYTQYKNADVTQAVRSGNNWVKIQRHKLRFKFIRKYIKCGHVFDLGAGWGHFMLAAKELGYSTSGIEISEQPYLYCVNDLKLPVQHIDFFDLDPQLKYDVITMWDVLEHIDKADEFLKKCNEHTKDGGYLFLQVPQIDSYFAKKHKDNWKMMGLDHVNYFGKKTITEILKRNGFEVLEIKSSFEIKLFVMYTLLPFLKRFKSKEKKSLRETNTTINAAERQNYFNKITKLPKWMLRIGIGIHNLIYNFLSWIGVGEEMMVAAKKVKNLN